MKKIYICAVFGLLFASCSTDEGQTESVKYSNEVHTVTTTNWLNVMTSIEQACQDKGDYFSTKLMITHVENKALSIPGFVTMMDSSYVTPMETEVKNVMNMDKTQVINSTNYSATAKAYLKQVLVDNKEWAISPEANPLLSAREVQLLQFVKDINDPDDDWNGRKPLAFVYGYQNSDARAVLFAAIAHEYKKVK
ncbi:hypothetical protein [Myroides sp. WP-1]|uniref:hypothetical protein n=1 Tax=Myroides sp. WP-1 TaxID=2759944 RepID=UPI0015FC583A|nr:hypothetical protein [Myroides sp. WP-1]MBB1140391.1 hypothetical protein [Myroides sp. WP-1]